MKSDLYTRITDQIVAALEQGVRLWHKPWDAAHVAGPVSRPLRSNGKPYCGINVLMLWAAAMEKGYSAPIWMTYRQALELGGQVRSLEAQPGRARPCWPQLALSAPPGPCRPGPPNNALRPVRRPACSRARLAWGQPKNKKEKTMGLDMYAYATSEDIAGSVDFNVSSATELHYWKKHPDLHGWMEKLYREKGGSDESFNCVNIQLCSDDLDKLEADIKAKNLPPTQGFFFGASDGSEVDRDLEFVSKARDALAAGATVFYSSWW